MPQHVIVDGSNLATEGRTMPSLQQLNEAIASYRSDHPDVLMTVVVDATFGHRIDPKEVAEFEKAIDSNEFVAPPAGAVGRGDGFILSIAKKANASILSNDSYQEFHGEYDWLFDEGRLIGGKPVPHVGWVFVNRVPVRGPISRRSVKEGKTVEKSPNRRRGQKTANDAVVIGSASANAPMPVPKAPPPGAVLPGMGSKSDQSKGDQSKGNRSKQDQNKKQQGKPDQQVKPEPPGKQAQPESPKSTTNDLLAFLSFVEHFPVGTAVTGIVESYSSHGAYVTIGDVHGYVPLRLMADPAPRSAREAMDLGETVTLVVSSFGAARRSIDLAVPSMAPVVAPATPKARRGAKAAAAQAAEVVNEESAMIAALVGAADEPTRKPATTKPATTKPARGKTRKKAAPGAAQPAPALAVETIIPVVQPETPVTAAPIARKAARRSTSKPSSILEPQVEPKPTQSVTKKTTPRRVKQASAATAAASIATAPSPAPAKTTTSASPRRRPPKQAAGAR